MYNSKQTIFILILIVSFFSLSFSVDKSNKTPKKRYNAIHSGIAWFDQNNKEVNAHGACILKEGDKYYLFGEYHTDTSNAFVGFCCYSSEDLMNWNFERIVLPMQSEGFLGPNRVGERVKVMKCPSTGEFVMYMHTDDLKYKDPHVGYATCKTVNGDYNFQGELLMDGKYIKKWDLGTFQDTDGKGYLLTHSGFIYQLADDYKSVTRIATSYSLDGESPAMFKSGGIYYWMFSHRTSWERNDNFYLTSNSIEGPWTTKGLFAPEGSLTWNSQCSFILPIMQGNDTLYMYMGDRWSYPKQGSAATQVWQPITVTSDEMSIPEYQEAWSLSDCNKQSKYKIITDEYNFEGSWQTTDTSFFSNEKGAKLTIPFKGRRVGIKALSNPTSGYAEVIIKNAEGKEILHTIVDFYSKYEYISTKFLSPELDSENYTLTVQVMGVHPAWSDKRKSDYGSKDDYISIKNIFIQK